MFFFQSLEKLYGKKKKRNVEILLEVSVDGLT